VYHVLDYSEPKLIRRIGKLRKEWLPGVLSASFVIQDLERQKPVCQTEVMIVQNDVREAPISARLRSMTRDRLTKDLGTQLQARAAEALSHISGQLRLPQP
jgi:hypothetical protein